MPNYLVKNTNGATLGGFLTLEEASEFASVWERRYRSSKLVKDVRIVIVDMNGGQR